MSREIKGGQALLYSFPFWILCEKTNEFCVEEIEIHGTLIRVYPPFRSGKPNFTPMPPIAPNAIPFCKGQAPNIDPNFKLINISVLPGLRNRGKPSYLKLVWGEEWDDIPEVMPMDSLRIDILNQGDETKNKLASEYVSRLLSRLRNESNQWWIDRSVASILGNLRASFKISNEGAALEVPYGHSSGRSPFGFERLITNELWNKSIFFAKESQEHHEEDVLVLDAYFLTATGDLRRAILDAATAAEMGKDRAFERIWKKKNKGKKFRRGKILSGYELPIHLNYDLEKLAGVSFAKTHPKDAILIERLWKLRGKVAHGLPLTFSSAKGTVKLEDEAMAEMISAVRILNTWLVSLKNENSHS